MITLSKYLVESLDVEKLKHLEHAEDHIIHGGHEGVAHAHSTLQDVISFLEGKPGKLKITTKYDGSPSIVFGIDPKTKKFFVATKSAFNKNPKINYTIEDIQRNHGHAPGLVKKLTQALEELPKIMPKTGGVYQGDLMYSKDDLNDNGNSYSFTPNTITYSADKNSARGRSIAASNMGIVIHTKYEGKNLQDMKAGFDVDQGAFKTDPSVHVINPEIDGGDISPIEKKKYEKTIEEAEQLYAGMEPDVFNILDGHDITMKTYINELVRKGTWKNAGAEGYIKFLTDRAKKEIEKAKTQKKIDSITEKLQLITDHIKNHKKQFNAIFKLHSLLGSAKDTLIGALSRADTGFKTTIGGEPVKPEGFVATRNGRPTKLVDRAEFSRANFLRGKFQGMNEPVPDSAIPKKPIVFAFGRMNPPTVGHGALVDKVKELAKENKSDHLVVLSKSEDPEKNPLSPENKLKHAKRFFPGTNIAVADKDAPDFLKQIARLHKAGYTHLVMVAGSDRVEEYQKTLERYNGEGEGKLFNFKGVQVVSAGDRDPDAEGVAGMSASKMRAHALGKKKKEFMQGVPAHVKPEHAEELYNDVRQAMDIKIDQNTPMRALVNHSRRKDVIGIKAKKELERRKIAGQAEQARAKLMKPKPIRRPLGLKEEMTVDDIRGLGYITGNPLVDAGFQTTWTTLNQADADTRDQIMNQTKKAVHDDLHTGIEVSRVAAKNLFVDRLVNSIKSKSYK